MIISPDKLVELANVASERLFQETLDSISETLIAAAKEGKFSVTMQFPSVFYSRILKEINAVKPQNNCEYVIKYLGSCDGKASILVKWSAVEKC